ncbi:hypothetical protein CHS0354_010572 [Potamilus streckersoni]|uniref:C-type lectin domain-containing protein n=1 Tax=Potamilus streckersoni TaxID=2493646 RepID=A0AAE0VPH6_9BIVA|nr:hypothetical protein CHS0354_010572 [Potamilus streckersoni]
MNANTSRKYIPVKKTFIDDESDYLKPKSTLPRLCMTTNNIRESKCSPLLTMPNVRQLGEPNDDAIVTGEDCGAIMAFISYKWNDMPCESRFGYICKKKKTGSLGCYQNWLEYDSNCYLFVQERTDWNIALQSCRQKGGDLASIANQEEQNFIFSQMPERKEGDIASIANQDEQNVIFIKRLRARVDGFWIGMSMRDIQTAKLFQWSDNSKVTFTTWSENEPNNYDDKERVCVIMDQQENSIEYASSCYKFVNNQKSWNNAQEYCVKEGGNLAVIMDSKIEISNDIAIIPLPALYAFQRIA